jgi:ABC-2 type transport system ATP-binding protein
VELFFAESSALRQAAEAVGWNATVHADADRLSIRVASDGSAAGVKKLLDLMDLRDITVQQVALHRPTLDEVLLTLTARKDCSMSDLTIAAADTTVGSRLY